MENVDNQKVSGNGPAEEKILASAGIPWTKTKDEAWKEVRTRISATAMPSMPGSGISGFKVPLWAVAASLLILAGSALFVSLHTRTLTTLPGSQVSITFPDGSTTHLNGGSELKWHPLTWKLNRKATLIGEGYFEVKPGRRFAVVSDQGTTTVLGTRFNILARPGTYEVSCLSGKVKVESHITDDAIILKPDEKAVLNDHGKLDLNRLENQGSRIGWMQAEWVYTNDPLIEVIQALEAHYQVRIILPASDNHRYTGGFDASMPVEYVLDLVCTPFGYTFTQKSAGEFEIHPK